MERRGSEPSADQSQPPSDQQSASSRIPIINIPSYDEVLQQSRPQAARILFQPSHSSSSCNTFSHLTTSTPAIDHHDQTGSFNQAFSFLKKSDSYSPPPVVSAPPSQPPGVNGPKPEYVLISFALICSKYEHVSSVNATLCQTWMWFPPVFMHNLYQTQFSFISFA